MRILSRCTYPNTGQIVTQSGRLQACINSLLRTTLVARLVASLLASLAISLLSYSSVQAADVAVDVRKSQLSSESPFDGYIEISGSLIRNQIPIEGADDIIRTVAVAGHLEYRRFFLDAYAESYNQIQVGYSAFSNDFWSIDILGASSEHGVDSELNRELQLFSERDPALFIGARATAYKNKFILHAEALTDVSGIHGGSIFTTSIARNWLYKNWNFHALLGARYESASALDYQFGNDAEDATEELPAYTAGSGATFVIEAGVKYPFNQYLIFSATARRWALPSAVTDSPFITDEDYLSFGSTITFVY